jgi:predicted methyltransferase
MTSRSSFRLAGLFSLLLYVLDCSADAAVDIPAAVTAAVADPRRPAEQTKLDAARRTAASIAFARVKPGDRVVDFMPGNAYFTRILSDIVGPAGRVYAFIPTEQIANCPAREIAGTQAIARDPGYANVTVLTGALADFHIPQKLDLIWTVQNYHDLHDSFLGPANVAALNRAFFNALKPGGFLLVIDHVAESGSGLRDTETLHRIDPARIKTEIEAAGFVLESQSDVLRNAADDHRLSVFDPLIRGRTDQISFLFRRPQ